MHKKFACFLYVSACVFLLTACGCSHQWAEASCTTPKTCVLCNETDGEALGHTSGELEEIPDYSSATIKYIQNCSVCGENLKYDVKQITTFLKDGKLILTPFPVLERLDRYFEKTPEDDGYNYFSEWDTNFKINLLNNGDYYGAIFFFKEFKNWEDYQILKANEIFSVQEVDAVSLHVDHDAEYLDLLFFLMNPRLSADEIAARKAEVYADTEDFIFFDQECGLCYEFRYIKSDSGDSIENVHVIVYSKEVLDNT